MKNQVNNKEGFTIIEVVLVLAIAALIMLMVFIALPALQRSQRDTQRKDDVSRLQAAVTSYKSNERGQVPFADGVGAARTTDFVENYIILDDTSAFADPQGPDYTFSTSEADMEPGNGVILVLPNKSCSDATTPNEASPSSRGGAFRIGLESGGSHCIEY